MHDTLCDNTDVVGLRPYNTSSCASSTKYSIDYENTKIYYTLCKNSRANDFRITRITSYIYIIEEK